MDLITAIQIEDAIKNKKLVENRVLEVANICHLAETDAKFDRETTWQLDHYHVAAPPSQGASDYDYRMWTQVSVHLVSRNWDSHPINQDRDYGEKNAEITRMVNFPFRYLVTPNDSWIDEWKARVEFLRANAAASFRLDHVRKSIVKLQTEHLERIERLQKVVVEMEALVKKHGLVEQKSCV